MGASHLTVLNALWYFMRSVDNYPPNNCFGGHTDTHSYRPAGNCEMRQRDGTESLVLFYYGCLVQRRLSFEFIPKLLFRLPPVRPESLVE